MKENTQKGFTLIELLVVVAVIGILATVVVGQVGKARRKAQIQRIDLDISEIQKTLELYYVDHGKYPDPLPRSSDYDKYYGGEVVLLAPKRAISQESFLYKLEPYGFDAEGFINSMKIFDTRLMGHYIQYVYSTSYSNIRTFCHKSNNSIKTNAPDTYTFAILMGSKMKQVDLESDATGRNALTSHYCYVQN